MRPPTNSPAIIVALGDSITWGYPHGPSVSWVARASERLGSHIHNLGVNGDSFVALRRRVDMVVALAPKVCIVSGGTNDVSLGRSVPDMAQDLIEIVTKLTDHHITPVLGMPIPYLDKHCERELASLRHFMNGLAGIRKLQVVPFHTVFVDEEGEPVQDYYVDEVHPSLTGYAAMAELAVERLAIHINGGV